MRITSNAFLVVILSLAVSLAQQKVPPLPHQVVVVSDSVGTTIDAQERATYGLFPNVQRFREAVFIQASDSNFYARCTVLAPDGRDSLVYIEYSRKILSYIAEKITHYDGLVDGSYHIGDQPPPLLRYESGAFLAADSASLGRPAPVSPAGTWTGNYPLADATGYAPPAHYPLVNVGVSIRTYNPDVSGLQPAYGSEPQPEYWPMIWAEMDLMLFREIGLEVAGGASFPQQGWGGTAGIVLYPEILTVWRFRLFAGGGLAFASIEHRPASLVMHGGQKGYYVQGGVELFGGSAVAMDILVAYYGYAPLQSTFTETLGPAAGTTYPVSVDLSSIAVGLRLRFLQ